MKNIRWQIMLGGSLIALSAITYYIHYLLFRDAHHIWLYLVGDIAFVFIEVLLVTLIIHRVIEDLAIKARLEKMNMVIGAFFSEVGMKLLRIMSESDSHIEKFQMELLAKDESPDEKYMKVKKLLKKHHYGIQDNQHDWEALREFLVAKKDFLLRLLENSNLLEHETFTDVLRAVFHLAEELEARESLINLPNEDHKHLGVDTQRVYGKLTLQWLAYMEHLKKHYPYMYSLSVRTNPFNRKATAVVQEKY